MGMFNHPIGTASRAPKKIPNTFHGKEAGAHSPGMTAEDQPAGEENPEAIAAEHGPAHEVHMTHEHEMGAHHVHSVHPDGHEHHSDHESAEKAHDHAKKLAAPGGEGRDSEEGYESEGY